MAAPEKLEKLYQELAEVERAQQEVHVRLRELAPAHLRRGGPPMVPGGRGAAPRNRRDGRLPPGSMFPPRRQGDPPRPVFGDLAERRGGAGRMSHRQEAPSQHRLASAVIVAGTEDGEEREEEEHPGGGSDRWDGGGGGGGGMEDYGAEMAEEAEAPRKSSPPPVRAAPKRPAPSEIENTPDVKRRNRRMFGALLGTLQQFRKEDDKFKTAVSKREEALKRAAEKSEAKTKELRAKEREEMAAKRHAEITRKRELALQAEAMRVEINFHRSVEHRKKLNSFIFTKTEPAVLWLPVKHCDVTQRLLSEQQAGFNTWMEEEKSKMETTRAGLQQQIEELQSGNAADEARAASRKEDGMQEDEQGGGEADGAAKKAANGGAPMDDADMPEGEGDGNVSGKDEDDVGMADMVEPNPEGLEDLLS